MPEVLAHAAVGGCAGVELRCRAGELITPDQSDESARAVGDALRAGGLDPICVASYVQIGSPDAGVPEELERHLQIAAAVGASAVRVFGGDPDDPDVHARAVDRLRGAAAASMETGVAILLETHDAFLDGRSVARVLDAASVPSAGAIWDVLNPWRAGEEPSTTARHLEPWLRHVQIKDAASATDLSPLLAGSGAVPLAEILDLLRASGYREWVSLEWEAAWFPDALPLDAALTAFRRLLDDAA